MHVVVYNFETSHFAESLWHIGKNIQGSLFDVGIGKNIEGGLFDVGIENS